MGGFETKPGGSSLVQSTFGSGTGGRPIDAVGKRTLTEQLPPGPRSAPSPSTLPARQAGAPVLSNGGLGDWVGAGKASKIFRNTTAETFVDAATKQTVEIETNWMMAEFDQFELKTNMVMEVDRKIHIQLARSGVVIKSRARAFFHADQLPNDVHAALHAPVRLLTHDGAIFVTDDKGIHLLRSSIIPSSRSHRRPSSWRTIRCSDTRLRRSSGSAKPNRSSSSERAAYSPGTPDANALPLDNILGETTLEGILRVLAIPATTAVAA